VPSELQLADFFTKAQTWEQHQLHSSNPLLPPWVQRGVLSVWRPIYYRPIWPMRRSIYSHPH
jgi:hypothetical protein